jgi:thiamine biosynthesis lipoprotein
VAAHEVTEAQHLLLAHDRVDVAVGVRVGDEQVERVRPEVEGGDAHGSEARSAYRRAVAGPPSTRVTFRAMGTDVSVVVDGDTEVDAGAIAPDLLEHLEAKWSRFRATSEVSRLNDAGGVWTVVSSETFDLVDRAVGAWRDTGGRFDPTVLPALVAAGYDRDFAEVAAREDDGVGAPAAPAPGCAGVELDATVGAIRLPPEVRIDLGGIGKGRAADVLVGALLDAGARGVLADLGGDVGVGGEPPRDEGWLVEVDDPLGSGDTGRISLRAGAVATSTRLRRAWTRFGRPQHHLIDPRTGAPAATGLASVTVVAGSVCRAEVLAKAALVAGAHDGAALLAGAGVTGVLVHDDGRVEDLPGLAPFRA